MLRVVLRHVPPTIGDRAFLRSQPTPAGSSSFRDLSGRARFITGLDRRYALLVTVADEIGGLQLTCGAGLANSARPTHSRLGSVGCTFCAVQCAGDLVGAPNSAPAASKCTSVTSMTGSSSAA